MSAALSYLVKKKKKIEVYENAESRTDHRSLTRTTLMKTSSSIAMLCDNAIFHMWTKSRRCPNTHTHPFTHVHTHTRIHGIRPTFGLPHTPRIDDNFWNTSTTDAAGEPKTLPEQNRCIDISVFYMKHKYIFTKFRFTAVYRQRLYDRIFCNRKTQCFLDLVPRPLRYFVFAVYLAARTCTHVHIYTYIHTYLHIHARAHVLGSRSQCVGVWRSIHTIHISTRNI